MKGNRQGSLSRSITRRSDQNCKIILQMLILQFCWQLVPKVQKDFWDKLKHPRQMLMCDKVTPQYDRQPPLLFRTKGHSIRRVHDFMLYLKY